MPGWRIKAICNLYNWILWQRNELSSVLCLPFVSSFLRSCHLVAKTIARVQPGLIQVGEIVLHNGTKLVYQTHCMCWLCCPVWRVRHVWNPVSLIFLSNGHVCAAVPMSTKYEHEYHEWVSGRRFSSISVQNLWRAYNNLSRDSECTKNMRWNAFIKLFIHSLRWNALRIIRIYFTAPDLADMKNISSWP